MDFILPQVLAEPRKIQRRRLIFLIAAFLCLFPAGATADETWTPMEIGLVPAESPVWLRLRVDTVALETAVAARWYLVKRRDSLRTLPDGRRLLASELDLVRPTGVMEVTGSTWRSRSQGKVRLTLAYLDSRGTAGSLDAWLASEAIDRVFVFREVAPSSPKSSPGSAAARARDPGYGALFIMVGPFAGALAGYWYGKLKGDGGNSQPGMSAFVYTLGGMAIGLTVGIRFALLD